MNNTDILEGNCLIEVFIHPERTIEGSWVCWNDTNGTKIHASVLKYEKSWDELMPVIDDIYYSRRFNTGSQTSEISHPSYRLYKKIIAAISTLSIKQVWKAVVEWIKWYNQNQKP